MTQLTYKIKSFINYLTELDDDYEVSMINPSSRSTVKHSPSVSNDSLMVLREELTALYEKNHLLEQEISKLKAERVELTNKLRKLGATIFESLLS